jgi:Glycosyltransferase family 87
MLSSTDTVVSELTQFRRTHYVQDILLGILPIIFCMQFLAWLTFLPKALRGHADFRQLYVAGYMVRTGHRTQLYDYAAQTYFQNTLVSNDERALPFIRPAYQALIFVPFSLLPYRTAYLGFLFLNLLLLALAFMLLQSSMRGLSCVWPGLPPGLFLGFYPVALALMQGQDSILLLALLAAAFVSLGRNRDLAAGALAGLGLFKFQIVLPIVLLFLLWRRWRFVKGFVFSAILVGLLSFITTGWAETLVFVRSLFSVGEGLPAAPGEMNFPLRINIMANLRGLIYGLASLRAPRLWLQLTTLLLSSLVVISVRARGRQQRGGDALVLAITAGVVVSYYLFIHDLSILLIPIVLTLDRFISRNGTGEPFGPAAAAMSALLFVAPMCIFVIPAHFYLVSVLICGFLFVLMKRLPP